MMRVVRCRPAGLYDEKGPLLSVGDNVEALRDTYHVICIYILIDIFRQDTLQNRY